MENSFKSNTRAIWQEMRAGTAFEQKPPDTSSQKPEFYGTGPLEGIDYEKLVRFIKEIGVNDTAMLNWKDYAKSAVTHYYTVHEMGGGRGNRMEKLPNNIPFTYENLNGRKVEAAVSGKINKRRDYPDLPYGYRLSVNPKSETLRASLHYYYEGALLEHSEEVKTTEDPNDFTIGEEHVAISLYSNNLTDFCYLIREVQGKDHFDFIRNKIASVFADKLKSTNEAAELDFLYANLPEISIPFLKKMVLPETVLKHLEILKAYDDQGWLYMFYDSSGAIVNLLRTVGDTAVLYDHFVKNPALVKELYFNMDGVSVFNEKTEKNRTLFTDFLMVLCSQEKHKAFKNEKQVPAKKFDIFRVGAKYRLESNVMPGNDANASKIMLQQLKGHTEKSTMFYPDDLPRFAETVDTYETVFKPTTAEKYYHPLEPVYLVNDDDPKAPPLLVPALFVKAISDEAEWKDINRNIRIGLDVLALVVGVASLGSASPFVIGLGILDITLTSADILVALREDQLMKTEQGRKFLETWNMIMLAGGIATAGPLLVRAASKGAVVLLEGIAKSTKAGTIEFLKAAFVELAKAKILSVASSLKVVVVESIEAFANLTRLALSKLKSLRRASCQFVKIVDESGQVTGFSVLYKGEVIAQGTAKEIQNTLAILGKLSDKKLVAQLEAWIDFEALFKNDEFVRVYAEVLSESMKLARLTAEEIAVIRYYTTAAYEDLNRALRGIIPLTDELKAFRNLLKRALQKIPNSKFNNPNHTLYRSVEFSEEMIEQIRTSGKFSDPGFFSTAFDFDMFKSNWLRHSPDHNVIFRVIGKNGKQISDVSDIVGEAEVLFTAGSNFKAKVSVGPHPLNSNKTITFIDLIEI